MPRNAYVDMELGLPRGEDDSLMHVIVKQIKLDDDGNPIGNESINLLVDTRACQIEFIHGTTETITAKIIEGNLFA